MNGVLSDDDDEEFFDFSDDENDSVDFNKEEVLASSSLTDDKWIDVIDGRLDDAKFDKQELFVQMKIKKGDYVRHAGYLWRLAKSAHFAGIVVQSAGDIARKRELAFEAHK